MQSPLWNKQVWPKFINLFIENKIWHIYGATSTLFNVMIKHLGYCYTLLFELILFFPVTWCPFESSIYLPLSYNEHRIISETRGVIWHDDLESKIQLVNWKLSPEYLLENSSLPDIRAIDAYMFLLLSSSPFSDYFCDARLPLSLKRTCFFRLSLSL